MLSVDDPALLDDHSFTLLSTGGKMDWHDDQQHCAVDRQLSI